MKLHYMRTMNPRKACATAKHLNLPVEYVPIDVARGGLQSADYLGLNPNGLAPVLEDDGYTLWESAAIMAYFAVKARSPLWPAEDPAKQVEVLRWISWDLCHFAPHAGAFYFENDIKPRFGLGAPDAEALRAAAPAFHKSAHILDRHLATREYLVGDTLTIADFCVGVLLPDAGEIELPVADYRHIQRWHERLMSLPAWRDPWPA